MTTDPTCSVAGCVESVAHREWCLKHYRRWLRNGDPTAGRIPHGSAIEFVRSVVEDPPDGCAIFPYYGGGRRGRPRVWLDGKQINAARAALILATGGDRHGMHAAHEPLVCHNPLCVNPRHLRWATAAENAADKAVDRTLVRGAAHPTAKFTEADIRAIRADDRPHSHIAAQYGTSKNYVWQIKNRHKWAWVD